MHLARHSPVLASLGYFHFRSGEQPLVEFSFPFRSFVPCLMFVSPFLTGACVDACIPRYHKMHITGGTVSQDGRRVGAGTAHTQFRTLVSVFLLLLLGTSSHTVSLLLLASIGAFCRRPEQSGGRANRVALDSQQAVWQDTIAQFKRHVDDSKDVCSNGLLAAFRHVHVAAAVTELLKALFALASHS